MVTMIFDEQPLYVSEYQIVLHAKTAFCTQKILHIVYFQYIKNKITNSRGEGVLSTMENPNPGPFWSGTDVAVRVKAKT